MNAKYAATIPWKLTLGLTVIVRAATGLAQTPTRFCTPASAQSCVASQLSTAANSSSGTDVTLRVTNLQGTAIDGVTPVSWSQLYMIDLIGSGSFAGGSSGPLTVAREGGATEAGDVQDRWNVSDIAELPDYSGFAVSTDIDQAGAEINGCTRAPNSNYPFYQTCGSAGDPGALVFQFSTSGTWAGAQVTLIFLFRTPSGNVACQVRGSEWSAPDIPDCVTPGAAPPGKVAQAITFTSNAPAPAYVGDTYSASATASSGLDVTLNTLTPTTCTISQGVVTFVGSGSCTISADQDGNAGYFAADQITQVVNVLKRAQTIVFSAPSSPAIIGTSASLSAAGGASGNAIIFSSLSPSVCVVSGSTVSYVGVGSCILAADQAGNAAYLDAPQSQRVVSVVWPFTGFGKPVSNSPALNSAPAGSSIPVKFSLGGDRTLAILAVGSPTVSEVSCSTLATVGSAAPASGSLDYDLAADLYTFVWKTSKTYTKSCRQLIVVLADGTTHKAIFSFK